MTASDSKIIYFPFLRYLCALITKQVNNKMFLELDSIFRFSGYKLSPFLNGKTGCFTEKYYEIKISRFLKLFSSRKTSTKAGNIPSFLGSNSEPCPTYKMERFANIVDSWKLLTFCGTLHVRYLTELWIHLWRTPKAWQGRVIQKFQGG